MNFEVGKKYLCRNGETVTVTAIDKFGRPSTVEDIPYPSGTIQSRYFKDGTVSIEEQSPWDIIEEYEQEEGTENCFPIWKKNQKGKFTVRFDEEYIGTVVKVHGIGSPYSVGYTDDEWISCYDESVWKEPHEQENQNPTFENNVDKVLGKVKSMLIQKNKAYGDSALNPQRIFAKSDAMEQLNVRIDDKLNRIKNGDTSEDAPLDLLGYLILREMKKDEES
jgi:hypothetical protein